jgi:hypothetical protein
MPPKKTPAAVLQRARENGSESNREGTDNALKCDHLHLRCAVSLESVQKLRFHYEDVHCVSFAKGTKKPLSHTEIETGSEVEPKAGRPDMLRNMTPDKAKRKGTILQTAQCTFAHKTVESFMAPPACLATASQAVESVPATHHPSRGLPAASPASLGHSLSMPHWRSDGSASAAETPASSANSDDWLQFIDLQLVGKPDAPIDREAELGADRPSKLRKPTPDKAEVKDTFVQPARYVFVHETGRKPTSTTATTGPHKARALPRAKSHVVVLEDCLPTANPPASISQDSTGSEGNTSSQSEGLSPMTDWTSEDATVGTETPGSSMYCYFSPPIDLELL